VGDVIGIASPHFLPSDLASQTPARSPVGIHIPRIVFALWTMRE